MKKRRRTERDREVGGGRKNGDMKGSQGIKRWIAWGEPPQ